MFLAPPQTNPDLGGQILGLLLLPVAVRFRRPGYYPYGHLWHKNLKGQSYTVPAVNTPVEAVLSKSTCSKCGSLTWVSQGGYCVACGKKVPYAGPCYVKPGTKVFECRPRVLEKHDHATKGLYPIGLLVAGRPQGVDSSSWKNDYMSVVRRAAAATPRVDNILWDEFAKYADRTIQTILKETQHDKFELRAFMDWFPEWNKRYPKGVRKRHERAAQEFADRTLDNVAGLPKKKVSVGAFGKREKIKNVDENGYVDHIPRLIQPFDDHTKIATAYYYSQLQDHLHTLLKGWKGSETGSIRFVAGDNCDTLSAWFDEEYASKKIISTDDFSYYDTTFHSKAHQLIISLCSKYFSLSGWPLLYRKLQVNPTLFTRHGVAAKIRATMRSGAADTCMSNSIIQLLVHTFAVHKLNPSVDLKEELALAGLGDDNLMLTSDRVRLAGLGDILTALGLIPKLQVGVPLTKAVFLNMLPYPIAGGKHKFAPLIGRLISRLGWSCEPRPCWQPYLLAVAKAFKASCRHVPVLRAYVSAHEEALGNFDRKYEESLAFKQEFGYKPIFSSVACEATAETYNFLRGRYGLSRNTFKGLEMVLSTMGKRRMIQSSWVNNAVNHMVDIDYD